MNASSAMCARTPDAQTIVCFGDSITQTGYPEALANLLKFNVVNSGVGGNSSAAGLQRLQTDVLDHVPAVVVILFGTNDTRLDAPEVHVPLELFEHNLMVMVRACQTIGARVVLCTIPPIREDAYFTRHERDVFEAAGGLHTVLGQYRQAVRRLAIDESVAVADLARSLEDHPDWLSDDGVHPSKQGVGILAEEIAKAIRPLIRISR